MASRARPPTSRPGRPRVGEREHRETAVLEAAFDVLVERGYAKATMAAIARRAGASKETLYAWFGDKEGLFAALIRRQADATNAGVQAALEGDDDLRTTLEGFAINMLRLLLGPRALAINRAAISELPGAPPLADVLLREGRLRTGALVERYLARQADRGVLDLDDPAAAFRLLYGLVVQDLQIRALLGEPPPSEPRLRSHARVTVDRFLALTGHTAS